MIGEYATPRSFRPLPQAKKGEAFASPFPIVASPYQAWPLPFAALTPSFSVLKVAGVAVTARVILMGLVALTRTVAFPLLIGALARLASRFRFRRIRPVALLKLGLLMF